MPSNCKVGLFQRSGDAGTKTESKHEQGEAGAARKGEGEREEIQDAEPIQKRGRVENDRAHLISLRVQRVEQDAKQKAAPDAKPSAREGEEMGTGD